MSKEKSQFENVTMPTAEGAMAKKKTGPSLPAGFSVGQSLEKEKPVSRAESVKSFLPSFLSQVDLEGKIEKEKKAQMEKEGINYDLYLLIKNKLAGEFREKLERKNLVDQYNIPKCYDILKQCSLADSIKENPKLYTPNSRDLQFISNNLREFFPKIEETDYSSLGVFLNSFIHAYFNSVPQEERNDLKLYLPNTKDLDYIGTELSFGELRVDGVKDFFGFNAHGETVLKAQEVGDFAGFKAHGKALIEAKKVKDYFGFQAHGEAVLKTKKAQDNFGSHAHEKVLIEAETVGWDAGDRITGEAQVLIKKNYASVGDIRRGDSKVILPDGRILKAGESVF